MNERTQPVHAGVSKKGEIIWKRVPMSYWQMAMFPVQYCGSMIIEWIRRSANENGKEFNTSSFDDIRVKTRRVHHKGD